MEIISGKIIKYDERGLVIAASYDNPQRAALRQYDEVHIGLPDGRTILPEQRKKAYALIGEIARWMGESGDLTKDFLKLEFVVHRLQALEKKVFSLSDCDVTTAKEFISYLIDFVVEHDVPLKRPLLQLCDDIERAVYTCLLQKRCVLCGEIAQLHHVDAIGMGNDRDEIFQIGMRVAPLCGEHHGIAHTKGREWLLKDMHVIPIPLTVEIGKVYKLTKKNLGVA